MKATLLLADSAQADPNGKVHGLGVGWSMIATPTPPMAIIVLIDCPWDQTNMKHQLTIDLVDADGRPVSFEQDSLGSPEPAVHIEADFESGRPPGIPAGTPLRQPFVINLGPGLPLTPGQKYEFRISINDEPMDSSLGAFTIQV